MDTPGVPARRRGRRENPDTPGKNPAETFDRTTNRSVEPPNARKVGQEKNAPNRQAHAPHDGELRNITYRDIPPFTLQSTASSSGKNGDLA